jgi:hypothetical protein
MSAKTTRRAASSQRRAKQARKPLSRRLLGQLIEDLVKGLRRQVEVAESIMRTATPHGDTLQGAGPMLTVLELALDKHLGELQQVKGRVRA